MPNMHYCRFQNTLLALQTCLGSMEEQEVLSADEERAKMALVETCRMIVELADENEGFPK